MIIWKRGRRQEGRKREGWKRIFIFFTELLWEGGMDERGEDVDKKKSKVYEPGRIKSENLREQQ